MAADISYIPDGNNQVNSVLPWMLAAGNGGYGFGGGLLGGAGGAAFIGSLVGSLFPNLFGWGGMGGYGGGAGMGYLGNQMNNDNNTDLIMEGLHQNANVVGQLASTLNSDFNAVSAGLNAINTAVQTVGAQNGMGDLQIVNALQAGDAALGRQFCEAMCNLGFKIEAQGYQNQIRTVEQTGALTSAIAGVNQNIAANRAAQELSDCKQTYTLTDTMNRNFLALDNKIDALESSRKDREIAALTAKVAQLESQNFTTGVVGSAVAPVNAALNAIAREVDDIKCKLPNTVNVEYPNLVAVNATPYVSGGYYQGGFGNGAYFGPGYGYGFGGGINF